MFSLRIATKTFYNNVSCRIRRAAIITNTYTSPTNKTSSQTPPNTDPNTITCTTCTHFTHLRAHRPHTDARTTITNENHYAPSPHASSKQHAECDQRPNATSASAALPGTHAVAGSTHDKYDDDVEDKAALHQSTTLAFRQDTVIHGEGEGKDDNVQGTASKSAIHASWKALLGPARPPDTSTLR